jgi:hypothetical protein
METRIYRFRVKRFFEKDNIRLGFSINQRLNAFKIEFSCFL